MQTKDETSAISGVRLSPCRQYLLVMAKDKYARRHSLLCLDRPLTRKWHRPVEIWDMRRLRLACTAFDDLAITSLEWASQEQAPLGEAGPPASSVREDFLVCCADGQVRHYFIHDGIMSAAMRPTLEVTAASYSALCWYVSLADSGEAAYAEGQVGRERRAGRRHGHAADVQHAHAAGQHIQHTQGRRQALAARAGQQQPARSHPVWRVRGVSVGLWQQHVSCHEGGGEGRGRALAGARLGRRGPSRRRYGSHLS